MASGGASNPIWAGALPKLSASSSDGEAGSTQGILFFSTFAKIAFYGPMSRESCVAPFI